tara:strand:- start:5 stop:1132 length:1128 start_codon:yes stop_codon:yes gene_type:complete
MVENKDHELENENGVNTENNPSNKSLFDYFNRNFLLVIISLSTICFISLAFILYSSIGVLRTENNTKRLVEKINNSEAIIKQVNLKEKQLESLEIDIRKENITLKDITRKTNNLTDERNTTYKENQDLLAQNQALSSKIEANKNEQKQLEESIRKKDNERRGVINVIQNKNEEKESLEKELEKLRDERSPYNEQRNKLLLSMTKRENKIKESSSKIEEFNNTFEGIIDELQTLKNSLNLSEQKIKSETEVFKNNNINQKKEIEKIESFGSKINQQSKDIGKIEINLSNVKKKSDDIDDLLIDIKEIKNTLNKNISISDDLKDDINTAKSNIQSIIDITDRKKRSDINSKINGLLRKIEELEEIINDNKKKLDDKE